MVMELEAGLPSRQSPYADRDGIGEECARGRGRPVGGRAATRWLAATLPRGSRSGAEGKKSNSVASITGVEGKEAEKSRCIE